LLKKYIYGISLDVTKNISIILSKFIKLNLQLQRKQTRAILEMEDNTNFWLHSIQAILCLLR
jgi:hypothetical protein